PLAVPEGILRAPAQQDALPDQAAYRGWDDSDTQRGVGAADGGRHGDRSRRASPLACHSSQSVSRVAVPAAPYGAEAIRGEPGVLHGSCRTGIGFDVDTPGRAGRGPWRAPPERRECRAPEAWLRRGASMADRAGLPSRAAHGSLVA